MDLGVSLEQTLVAAKDGRKTVMGSVGYMAPEVEMGVAASKESDWYALGVLVFRLLTGVWCDSRTDVVGDLETYSPVWKEILPALLHSNPAGRSCPSWTELVRAQHERESLKAEQELAAVRDKLRRAKGAKKILVPICAVGLVVLAAGAGVMYRLSDKVADKRVTSFEQIVVIPEDAPLNEGVSPSDEQYRQARIDAWAFLCDEFIELSKGELGVLDLATKMSDLARRIVEDDVDDEDESDLPGFIRFGENDPLALLLYRGAERLFRRGGFTSEAERAAAGRSSNGARRGITDGDVIPRDILHLDCEDQGSAAWAGCGGLDAVLEPLCAGNAGFCRLQGRRGGGGRHCHDGIGQARRRPPFRSI